MRACLPRGRPVFRQVDSTPFSGTMYTVISISSIKGNYIYLGPTSNLSERIHRHNRGYERTTKPYVPFELINIQDFVSRPEARVHEKYLKSGIGKEFFRRRRNDRGDAGLSTER